MDEINGMNESQIQERVTKLIKMHIEAFQENQPSTEKNIIQKTIETVLSSEINPIKVDKGILLTIYYILIPLVGCILLLLNCCIFLYSKHFLSKGKEQNKYIQEIKKIQYHLS